MKRVLAVLLLATAGPIMPVPAQAAPSPQPQCLVAGPPCGSWWHPHYRPTP